MRKKCISLLMAVSMAAISPLSVYAAMSDDEFSYLGTFDGGTANTELEYIQSSSYVVKIPLRINNIVETGYVFTADSINILDTEKVNVYVENRNIEMVNGRGDTCSMEIRSSNSEGDPALVGTFRNGETTSSITMQAQIDPGARAGSYTGTATFSVRLE